MFHEVMTFSLRRTRDKTGLVYGKTGSMRWGKDTPGYDLSFINTYIFSHVRFINTWNLYSSQTAGLTLTNKYFMHFFLPMGILFC